jgi:hypothetical protein
LAGPTPPIRICGRLFLENPVHDFISNDGDRLIAAALVHTLKEVHVTRPDAG